MAQFWKGLTTSLSEASAEAKKLAATGAKATEKKVREEQISLAKGEWGRQAFELFMAGDMEAVQRLADESEAKIAPLREKICSLDDELSQVHFWGSGRASSAEPSAAKAVAEPAVATAVFVPTPPATDEPLATQDEPPPPPPPPLPPPPPKATNTVVVDATLRGNWQSVVAANSPPWLPLFAVQHACCEA